MLGDFAPAQHSRPTWMSGARRRRGRAGATMEAIAAQGRSPLRAPSGAEVARRGSLQPGKCCLVFRRDQCKLACYKAFCRLYEAGRARPSPATRPLRPRGQFRPQLKSPILNDGRVVRPALKEVPMLTQSPAERLQSRDPPARTRSGGMRRYARVRNVVVPRVQRGGDTDALDWRSDRRLMAILARVAQRERAAREKGQFSARRVGLGQPALRARRHPDRHRFTSGGAA